MPRPTRHDRLAAALAARGYVRDTAARSTKYATWRPGAECWPLVRAAEHRIYLGKLSLRYSSQCTIGTSVPFSPSTIATLLGEASAL